MMLDSETYLINISAYNQLLLKSFQIYLLRLNQGTINLTPKTR